jgi:hypothetical protein
VERMNLHLCSRFGQSRENAYLLLTKRYAQTAYLTRQRLF